MKRIQHILIIAGLIAFAAALTNVWQGAASAHNLAEGQGAANPARSGNLDAPAFDSFIRYMLAEYDVPGAVVAVVKDDQVIFMKGYGVREVGKPDKVDADTLFPLASNSKWMTAAALGTQVDQGLLTWDEPVVKHLPELAFADDYLTAHVSARDLLAHRVGITGGEDLGLFGYSNDEILKRVRYLKPSGDFRNKGLYSNIGFFIAGELAARLDPQYHTWADVVTKRVLQPLKMTRTSADDTGLLSDANHAAPHYGDFGDAHVVKQVPCAVPAAGSIVSTARDMTRWMRMLLGGGALDGVQVLKQETVQEMFRSSIPTNGATAPAYADAGAGFGLGAEPFQYNGYQVVEKGGEIQGFETRVTLAPDINMGIVVLANHGYSLFPDAVRARALEMYLGPSRHDVQSELLAMQVKGNQNAYPAPTATPTKAAVAAQPADLNIFMGQYQENLRGPFTISVGQDNALVMTVGPAKYSAPLEYVAANTFLVKWPELSAEKIKFSVDDKGQVTGFEGATYGYCAKLQQEKQ